MLHLPIQIDVETALPRVAKFLTHPDEDICCEAALALSESRSPDAFSLLREQADRRHGSDYDQVLLTSIGLLGLPESVDYLLQVITRPNVGAAITAVCTLRHCRDPQAFRERLAKVVKQTDNRQLGQVYAEEFPEFPNNEDA